MMTITGYITNLGKYNEGELIGKWVEFPLYEEELKEVLEEIGVSDKPDENGIYYEEYFFTDWEGLDFGEYPNIDDINNLAEEIEIEDTDEDLVDAIIEYSGLDYVLRDGLDADNYMLLKNVKNDYDLGYYYVHEEYTEELKNMGCLKNYIDYEGFGEYIETCSTGMFTDQGWLICYS